MNFEAGVDVFGDAREDRVGAADRERVPGVASGAFGVGIHRPADTGRLSAAEVEREAGAVMIFVDQSTGFGGGGLDRGHDTTGLSRRVAAGLPAGADARSAVVAFVARREMAVGSTAWTSGQNANRCANFVSVGTRFPGLLRPK